MGKVNKQKRLELRAAEPEINLTQSVPFKLLEINTNEIRTNKIDQKHKNIIGNYKKISIAYALDNRGNLNKR